MRTLSIAALLLSSSVSAPAAVSDCHMVRFADVGWTDISTTTAVAAKVLEGLGLKTKIVNASVPVSFASLKNKNVDLFLGNWMPSMAADIKPYLDNGSVEVLGKVLQGARYTLAVPKYVADAGVRDFADLERFKDKFSSKIYGIEAGNDGNRNIQKIIDSKEFGLGGWKLVESSEQGMLTQVMRASSSKQWIVFLAWEPHPMNRKLELSYLSGGDKYFGPQQGQSTVYAVSRRGYAQECPFVHAVIKNISFTLQEENELMASVLDDKKSPEEAAQIWLRSHSERLDVWLKGLKTPAGEPALHVVRKNLSLSTH